MKKIYLFFLVAFAAMTVRGGEPYTIQISYVMNKSNPPSYTFSTDFKGEALKYYWSFSDGFQSEERMPVHTFKSSGRYAVKVKIIDKSNEVHAGVLETSFEGGSSLTDGCRAGFAASVITTSSGAASKRVSFTNLSAGDIIECYWNFGDGTTSQEKNPIHEYTAYGEYKICLVIRTGNDCKSDFCMNVKLTDPAVPVIHSGKGYVKNLSSLENCGLVVVLSDGTILLPVQIVPAFELKEGQEVELAYEVLQNINTTCQAGKPVKIHKIAELTNTDKNCKAYFTATNELWSNTAMMKKMVFANLSTGNISECTWSFGDGTTSKELRPVHEYPKYGKYQVCLSLLTVSGCRSEYCTTIEVDSMAVIPCGFDIVIKQKDQSNQTFLFYAVSNKVIKSWKWTFGDGSGSDVQNPEHTYEKPGTYEASCTIVTEDGCTVTRSRKITIAEPALPVCPGAISLLLFDPSGPTTLCNGKAIAGLLDEKGVPFKEVSFSWSNGDKGDTAKNLCKDKLYSVHAVIDKVCQKNTSFAFLTKPAWRAETKSGNISFIVETPAEDIVYKWDFGDGNTAFGPAVDYTYMKDGEYNVTLTAISGNYSTESTRKVAVIAEGTTSLKVSPALNFKIYPNPAGDRVIIETEAPVQEGVMVELTDMKGQRKNLTTFRQSNQRLLELNIAHLPDGIYVVRILGANSVYESMKLLKKK
jgi:PKD repeat protein